MNGRRAFLKYVFQGKDGAEMCDKKSPVSEILFRFDAYSKLSLHALRAGIPLTDLIRARYPYRLPNPKRPTMAAIEFCNVCNLKCSYCPTRDDQRPKGYMTRDVFSRVIDGIGEMKINRAHIRGWGEPTLHPNFGEYVARLGQAVRLVDIVTNGQWKDEEIMHDLLMAPVHRIDVSVDAGGFRQYEETRKGGRYDLVLNNLEKLKALRDQLKAKSIITVRCMFRPTQEKRLKKEMGFLRQYSDAVMPAPIFRNNRRTTSAPHDDADAYTLTAALDDYPRCHFPLNQLSVCWDGFVPLCDNLLLTHDEADVYVGNVLERSLEEIWRSDTLRNLRLAHKKNVIPGRAICRGCATC